MVVKAQLPPSTVGRIALYECLAQANGDEKQCYAVSHLPQAATNPM